MFLSITWTVSTAVSNILHRMEFFSSVQSLFDSVTNIAMESGEWLIQEISFVPLTTELLGTIAFMLVALYGGTICQWIFTCTPFFKRLLRTESPPYTPRNKTYSEDTTAAVYGGHQRAKDDSHMFNTPALDGTEGSEEDELFGKGPKETLPFRHVGRFLNSRSSRNYFGTKRTPSNKNKLQKQQSFSQKFDMIPEEPSFAEEWEDDNGNEDSTSSYSIHDKQSDTTYSSRGDDDETTLPQSNESSQSSLRKSSMPSSLSPASRSKVIPAAELRSQLRQARNLPAPCLLSKQKYAVSTSALLKAVKQDRKSRMVAGRSFSLSKLDTLDAIRSVEDDGSNSSSLNTEPMRRGEVMIETRRRGTPSTKKSPRPNQSRLTTPSQPLIKPMSSSSRSSSYRASRQNRVEESVVDLGVSSSSSDRHGDESRSRKRRAKSQTKHLAEDCRLLERMFDSLNDDE